MRLILPLLIVAVLASSLACAQDDDGWNDIMGMMGGITAANGALGNLGLMWNPADPGGGQSGSQFLNAFAAYCQAYAQLLQSVEGAFSTDGPAMGFDPFDPRNPNPLLYQLQLLQGANQDLLPAFDSGNLFNQSTPQNYATPSRPPTRYRNSVPLPSQTWYRPR